MRHPSCALSCYTTIIIKKDSAESSINPSKKILHRQLFCHASMTLVAVVKEEMFGQLSPVGGKKKKKKGLFCG